MTSRRNRRRLPGAFYGTLVCMAAIFGLAVYSQARLQVGDGFLKGLLQIDW